jgi:hypothetical protein
MNISVNAIEHRNVAVARIIVADTTRGHFWESTGFSKRMPGDKYFKHTGEEFAIARALEQLAQRYRKAGMKRAKANFPKKPDGPLEHSLCGCSARPMQLSLPRFLSEDEAVELVEVPKKPKRMRGRKTVSD